MLNLLLPALLLLSQPAAPPVAEENVAVDARPAVAEDKPAAAAAKPAAAAAKPAAASPKLKPLSFLSQQFKFRWDQFTPLNVELDGLKVNSIFFNKRTMNLFRSAEFGTRAVLEVTNTSNATRVPGFAVAVFDAENQLLGVASGGPKIGGVGAGESETYELSFHQVVERIPRADHFIIAVELTN
jgi:hypothetical protein